MRVIPGYSITLRGLKNWDEYFNGLSKGFRRNLRRYRNALSETGETELGWCTTFDDAVRVLTWLFENKRQWAEDRGLRTRYLMGNEVRDFFIELARRTDLRVTPLVAFVKVNGVPVAASINLVGPQSVEYWMFTYDKAYSRYSVGNLLTEFVVRWAHANDRDFDMRTAYNEYKTYWANRETVNQTRYVFLTARGRAFEAWLVCYYLNRVQRGLRTRIASVLRAALINRVRR
jgi:CelD/BcsL family acetyltransferase involved in cellulose biosynthesis